MFEVTITNAIIYTFFLIVFFYLFFCAIKKEFIKPNIKKLIYTIFIFTLLGVIGEDFVNTFYEIIFKEPLWEYKLFPTHNANITYLFPFIWGTLGFYTYFRNEVFLDNKSNRFLSGAILGVEAVFIELIANVPYYYLFNDYIFYYLPANLGPFSHFSCLQVVPFYAMVGLVTTNLINQQEKLKYQHLKTTLLLYTMIMITFVYI